jgi:uncharacterized CHY-type Zn-finger protein
MNTEQEILNGCGIQENSWKSSLCKKDNLCSDCQDVLKWYRRGRKDAIEEFKSKIVLCKTCGKRLPRNQVASFCSLECSRNHKLKIGDFFG